MFQKTSPVPGQIEDTGNPGTIHESDSTHTPAGGVSQSKPRRANHGKALQFRKVAALSAALAERELGLPAGAWKRRRLFALRVLTGDLAGCGFARGDFLIIEPGAASVPPHASSISEVLDERNCQGCRAGTLRRLRGVDLHCHLFRPPRA